MKKLDLANCSIDINLKDIETKIRESFWSRLSFCTEPNNVVINEVYLNKYNYAFVNVTIGYRKKDKEPENFCYIYFIVKETVPDGPFRTKEAKSYKEKSLQKGKYIPISDAIGIIETKNNTGQTSGMACFNRYPHPEDAIRTKHSPSVCMEECAEGNFLVSLNYNGHTMAFLVDENWRVCSKIIYNTLNDRLYINIDPKTFDLSKYENDFLSAALILPNTFPGCGDMNFSSDPKSERIRKLVLSAKESLTSEQNVV